MTNSKMPILGITCAVVGMLLALATLPMYAPMGSLNATFGVIAALEIVALFISVKNPTSGLAKPSGLIAVAVLLFVLFFGVLWRTM